MLPWKANAELCVASCVLLATFFLPFSDGKVAPLVCGIKQDGGSQESQMLKFQVGGLWLVLPFFFLIWRIYRQDVAILSGISVPVCSSLSVSQEPKPRS